MFKQKTGKLWVGISAAVALTLILFWVLGADLPDRMAGAAPKKILLKSTLVENKPETIFYELEAEAEVTIPVHHKHSSMKLYSKLQREIKQKVLKFEKNNIIKVEREYISSKIVRQKRRPRPRRDLFDKKKIIIETTGERIEITGAISDHLKSTVSPNENNYRLILPGKLMAVGEEWSVPSEDVLKIFNFASSKRRMVIHGCTEVGLKARFDGGKMTCALAEIEKTDEGDYGVIKMEGVLEGEDNDLEVRITFTGVALFDIKIKRLTRVEIKGDIKLGGQQPCLLPGETSEVVGEGKIIFKSEFK